MAIKRQEELAVARASAAQKAIAKHHGGGSTARTMMSALIIGGAVLGACIYAYVMFGGQEVRADEVVDPKLFDANLLEAQVGPILGPRTERVEVRVPVESQREAAPPPAASLSPQTSAPMPPSRRDWAPVLRRSSGPLVVARAPEKPAFSADGGAALRQRVRHVPRGTRLLGVLMSRIVSDLADGRLRVKLLEEFRQKGDLLLPEGTEFIGTVAGVDDRWQKRVEVRIGNAILDGEREVEFQGLLMDVDESTHLPADDINYHTWKASLGVTGLAALGAVTSYAGAPQRNLPLGIAGSNTAEGLAELGEKRLERVLDRPPTLVVEPGRLVWVFVDSSFDMEPFDPVGSYEPAAGVPGERSSLADSAASLGMAPAPDREMVLAKINEMQERYDKLDAAMRRGAR